MMAGCIGTPSGCGWRIARYASWMLRNSSTRSRWRARWARTRAWYSQSPCALATVTPRRQPALEHAWGTTSSTPIASIVRAVPRCLAHVGTAALNPLCVHCVPAFMTPIQRGGGATQLRCVPHVLLPSLALCVHLSPDLSPVFTVAIHPAAGILSCGSSCLFVVVVIRFESICLLSVCRRPQFAVGRSHGSVFTDSEFSV